MPLIAVILALLLKLPPENAVGLLIMGCTAGGPLISFPAESQPEMLAAPIFFGIAIVPLAALLLRHY